MNGIEEKTKKVNEWRVGGEVFYLKEMEGEFAASVKIRGSSKRPGGFSANIFEFACLMTQTVYDEAKRLGIRLYHEAVLSGHLESWDKGKGLKTYFIVDKVESVRGYK